MDRGAHFFRCDFQVHTPRDINWSGNRPVTPEDRKDYAKIFIKACRDKGLNAVAITDHHDLGFFTFIRDAAENELTEQGELVSIENRICVFPGMELTLAVPCQALIIFDADFPLEFFDQVISRLGITCNSASEPKHAPTLRIDHLKTFQGIVDLLDVLACAKGRYILLPNINNSGEFTLMRQGFLAEYKSMPCVGGYLDHAFDVIGTGNLNILDGKTEAYGFKPLGIFPTSDNRSYDFSKLGVNTTWVKWAEPTAEALRQACLARKTRIFHTAPKKPYIVISRIEVSNSKFLGPINLELNPQFNCLIGGRGTGKSTVLEYLRWALCDQPPHSDDQSENSNLENKRRKLIENTLQQIGGAVTVDVVINGIRHTVRRKSDTSEILLKVGDQPLRPTNEEEIRSLLPIQGYSQKQLSGVGVRGDELSRFVESSGTREILDELANEADKTAEKVRRAFSELETKRKSARSTDHVRILLSSAEQQLAALKASLKGISKEDTDTLQKHEHFLAGNAIFEQWKGDAEKLLDTVQQGLGALEPLPHRIAGGSTIPDTNLTSAEQLLIGIFQKAKIHLEEARQSVSNQNNDWIAFQNAKSLWAASNREHWLRYDEVQSRVGAQQETLKQIASLEEQVSKARQQLAESASIAAGLNEATAVYEMHRKAWESTFDGKAVLIQSRCALLSDLSNGWIRANLQRGVISVRLSDVLIRLLQGSRIHSLSEKIESIGINVVKAVDPIAQWKEVIQEFGILSLRIEAEISPEINSPLLVAAGFNSNDLEKIASRLDRQTWLELSLIELEDRPVFEYKQREGDYIPFAEASAGQQATALLRVLLNQEGPPLVIDQPEDDLDNQVIYEISEQVGSAKQRRQIIFTSHNANLVVNGDADLVVAFGYRTLGEQSGGEIQAEGAIDIKQVRKAITSIMEGGEKAFQLRKAKYGF